MKTEITGLTIRIAGEEKTLTLAEAKELRDALNELLGAKANPMLDEFRKLVDKVNRNPPPVMIPAPYPVPVYPRPEPCLPWREPIVWCGTNAPSANC